MVKENRNRRHSILSLLFIIVIPLLVVSLLVYFILNIAGVDTGSWVKDKLSDTPVVSQFVTSVEEDEEANKIEKATETIHGQKEEIKELTKEIDSLEGIVADLELDIKRLSNRTVEDVDDTTTQKTDAEEEIKKIASSFRKMDPEKAAKIVENLQKNLAVDVLKSLSGDVRGKIFEEMKPELAAEIMKDMTS